MNKSLALASLAALIAVLTACGTTPAAEEPTAIPAPTAAPTSKPTATPEPTARPTEKPEPTAAPTVAAEPTAIPSDSGAADDNPIVGAIARAKQVKVYRIDLSMSGRGVVGELSQGADPSQEIPLLGMTGEFNGRDSHFTTKGLVAAFLGADPNAGFEVIAVGGRSYIHGPLPMLGAAEDTWYVADQSQASIARPQVDTGQFLDVFANKQADLSKITKAGSESLDGQQCDIYAGDKQASLAAFEALNSRGGSSPAFGKIDDAQMKFWVCGDGYMHQMQVSIAGTSKDKPAQKASFTVSIHLYDFNGDITIAAPESPQTLGTPSFTAPTAKP